MPGSKRSREQMTPSTPQTRGMAWEGSGTEEKGVEAVGNKKLEKTGEVINSSRLNMRTEQSRQRGF